MKTREGIPEEDVDMMLEGEPFYSVLFSWLKQIYNLKNLCVLKGKYHEVFQELLLIRPHIISVI